MLMEHQQPPESNTEDTAEDRADWLAKHMDTMRRVAAQPERTFAASLKAAREAHEWSQQAVAQSITLFGIPMQQTTIFKIESGQRSISLNEAVAFSKVFGTSLAGGPGSAPTPGIVQDVQSVQNIAELQKKERLIFADLQKMERKHRQALRTYLTKRLTELGPEEED